MLKGLKTKLVDSNIGIYNTIHKIIFIIRILRK